MLSQTASPHFPPGGAQDSPWPGDFDKKTCNCLNIISFWSYTQRPVEKFGLASGSRSKPGSGRPSSLSWTFAGSNPQPEQGHANRVLFIAWPQV